VNPAGAATAPVNPLQARNITGAADTPSLVSAEIRRGVTISAGVVRDQILYTFSEPVLINPAGTTAAQAARFGAYDSNANQIAGTTPIARSTTNDRQVLVTFGAAPNALDLAVGANVAAGAVIEATGGQDRPNQPDEVGIATWVPVRRPSPDVPLLPTSRRSPSLRDRDAFGTIIGATVTYTFDEDVLSTATAAANLVIYLADGVRYTCTAGTATVGTTAETRNQVSCS
jgi:hypothetical protein